MKKEKILNKIHADNAKYLESLLNPIPDTTDFTNGLGKVLQDKDIVSRIIYHLDILFRIEIIQSDFYDKNFSEEHKKQIKDLTNNPLDKDSLHFYVSRASFLPEYNKLIYRLCCIDKYDYEHGQIYFRLEEDKK